MLSHNPTMAVTPGIPPARNQCSRVQHTWWSHGHKSSIRGEAALMSPEWRRSCPLACAHIPCIAPTSLLDRVLVPLRLRKKCTPQESCVMPVGAMIYTPGIDQAHCGARPPCTFRYTRPSPFMRGHKNRHPLGMWDVRRFPALPRVRTTLCKIEELRMPNYATLLPLLFCAPVADR